LWGYGNKSGKWEGKKDYREHLRKTKRRGENLSFNNLKHLTGGSRSMTAWVGEILGQEGN